MNTLNDIHSRILILRDIIRRHQLRLEQTAYKGHQIAIRDKTDIRLILNALTQHSRESANKYIDKKAALIQRLSVENEF